MKAERIFEAAAGLASAAPFTVVPFDDLAHTVPPPQAFWWDHYMPAGVVTLFGAHGGTGKSFAALQLVVSIALGLPLFGVTTKRGTVAFFSGEDTADVLRRRLHHVCRALCVSVADLAGRLHILDATQGDPTLYREANEGGRRGGATTPSYEALTEFVEAHRIDVLVVDNASDAFDASENDRARVRAFMRALVQLALPHRGVLLLVHVDKGTSRGDRTGSESYSGSTAWHNSARSRLFLSRDRDGALLLEHQKSNHGPMREPLRLLWPKDGVLQVDEPVNGFVQHIADGSDTKALLKLLHEFYARGEFVATEPRSRYHVVKVLSGEATYPKRRKPAEVFQLVRVAERAGWIEREGYRDRNRKEHERWALTPSGCEYIGAAPPSAPSAPSTEDGAPDHTAQQGAPSAPCGVQGVWGNRARAEDGAEPDATDATDAPDSADAEGTTASANTLARRIAALEAAQHPSSSPWFGHVDVAAALASRPDGVELEQHLMALVSTLEASIPGAPIDFSSASLEQLRALASLRIMIDLERRT